MFRGLPCSGLLKLQAILKADRTELPYRSLLVLVASRTASGRYSSMSAPTRRKNMLRIILCLLSNMFLECLQGGTGREKIP